MTFLNPLFLWALPAALAPILIHLFHRRPPKRVLFSHIGWLREAHQVMMPRKKIKDRLLLLLRTLLALALVGVFARPVLQSGGALGVGSGAETMVLLIDVSASMGAVAGGRDALTASKENAQTLLRRLPAGTKVGLLAYSDRVEQEVAPTDERSRLLAAITGLAVRPVATDILPALTQASAMLARQPKSRKTLVILSDQARHGWARAVEARGHWDGFDPDVRIVACEVAPKSANAGVSDAALELSQEGVLKGRWTVDRWGRGAAPVWKATLNGRIVAQGETRAVEGRQDGAFDAQLPEGGFFSGQVELPRDAIPFDDIFYVAGRVPKGFRLLIVDGESGMAPADAESFYLRSALESPRDPRVESLRVIRPESLVGESFDQTDVIVLANTAALGGRDADLAAWVERGGGLLIAAGSQWLKPPDTPLRYFRSRAVAKQELSLRKPDPKTPFLSGIAQIETFQWDQVRVTEHIPLEPDAVSQTVVELSNGDPLLVRKQIGKGVVMCLTTTLDRGWTNLPAKPVFAPLMRELVAALADPYREQTALMGWVETPMRIAMPLGTKSVTVIGPDGTATGAPLGKDERLEWTPKTPGLYRVKTDQAQSDFSFAANIHGIESEGNPERVSEGELRQAFPNASVDYVQNGARTGEELTAAIQGRDVGNILLIFLFILVATETLLAWPRRRKLVLASFFLFFLSTPAFAGAGNNFVYVQLKYDGAWDPYPGVHERILDMVIQMTNIPVVRERRVVTLSDPALFESPFLIVAGNAALPFSPEDKTHLKQFIDRGGLVFFDDTLADARGPFAESVRRLMAELFPDRSFQKLPMDHALFRSFFLLRGVGGRRISEKALEGIDVGGNLGGEGRTAVIYCPNDLLGAWMRDNLGHYVYSCEPGGETQRWESFKLTINLIYFSLTGTYKRDAIHQPFIEMKLEH